MKFALLVSFGLALILAVSSSRDTDLAGLCYVDGVDKFVPLSECLRWVRDNGHRMLWEDSRGQEMTLGVIDNHVDEGYYPVPVAEEDELPEEWN